MGSFDDTSKIWRVLKKNTAMVLDDSGMQSISAKNRKQPAGIIREMPRTLAPMALRPCLSTSLPKNCPIFLKIDMLILSTLFYHTPPPGCQPVLPGFRLYSMLYFLLMWPKTFTFWCSLCFISFFCVKSGRKWLGSLFQALRAGLPTGKRLLSRFKPQKLISVPLPPCAGGVHRV